MEQNLEQNVEQINESRAKKKKALTIVLVVAGVLVVAAAAFIGGSLLNRRASPPGMLPFGGNGGIQSVSTMIEFTAAPELPTTAPLVMGTLAERQDNSIYIQTFSMDKGGGGVVISGSGPGAPAGDPSTAQEDDDGDSPGFVVSNSNMGPKVEVVITNDTLIYADVTEMPMDPGEGTTHIQQVVELSNLDDVNSMTMLTVWGRKVGDRVIAEVIAYSNPVMIQRQVNP